MVRATVHTNPSRKRRFLKKLKKRRKLKPPAFPFCVDGKHFENGVFRKRLYNDNHVISPPSFPQITQMKNNQ